MAIVFMTDPATGRCALFTEPSGSGLPDNPAAPRNAPLNNVASNLQYTFFHSDLDYCEVSHGPTNVVVNHPSVAAASGPGGQLGVSGIINYDAAAVNRLLLTHSLGYVPNFMVVANDDVLYGGMPIQYLSDGRTRNVTAYATTTEIRLSEVYVRTSSVLPAISVTYTIIVFRNPPTASGNILVDFDPVTGQVIMAKNKFDSTKRYLQIVPGGTPFGFARGRTIDLKNGAPRLVDPDGTITDIVPSSMATFFYMPAEPFGSITYGSSMAYNGSFVGTPGILVQVP